MLMIISEKKKTETMIILYLHHVAPCAHNKPRSHPKTRIWNVI